MSAEMDQLPSYAGVIAGDSKLLALWLKPIEPSLQIVALSSEKPLGAMTMPELLAWFNVIGYGGISGAVIATVLWNLGRVAIGARR